MFFSGLLGPQTTSQHESTYLPSYPGPHTSNLAFSTGVLPSEILPQTQVSRMPFPTPLRILTPHPEPSILPYAYWGLCCTSLILHWLGASLVPLLRLCNPRHTHIYLCLHNTCISLLHLLRGPISNPTVGVLSPIHTHQKPRCVSC